MFQRQVLFCSTIIAGAVAVLAAPTLALAQQTGGADQAPETSAEVDTLIVTGSRIPRPNLEQPTPVQTINRALIENSGTSSLGDVLAQLPALSSNGTVRANSDSGANLGGLSFPDLRDLGTSRTLTLVNGKRHVAGDAGDTAVDLNSIPTALVDRVEVITGGASAIYGSDAVSGVINIILRDDFEGYEFNIQGGGPLNGKYGQNASAYATGGWNFGGGRGNLTITGFADQQERVRGPNVKGLRDWATIENPDDTGPADGIPDRLYRPYVQTEFFSPFGNLVAASDFAPISGFNQAGAPVGIPPRTGDNNFYYGSFASNCVVCTSSDATATLIPRSNKHGVESTFRYNITDNIRFRGDVKYVKSKTIDTFSSSFTTFEYVLDPDNAFITPAIQAVLDERPGEFYYVNRTNDDIGGRNDDTRRETFRAVGSLDGKFDAGFSDIGWEASYNYGRTQNKFHSTHGLIPGNFQSAIDAVLDPATNTIRCRRDVLSAQDPDYEAPEGVTDETCVPFNLFGAQNSAAAMDYVTFEADRKHTITQQVAGLTFNFDTERFFKLQGGGIGFAGGFEYRKEESENINDPFVQSGITETAPQPDATGGFNVKEVFAEFDAPILKDKPFAYRLSIDGAVRYADYSHAGDATSYKVGGIWAPAKELTFRGTYSRAVRAPNITEAFLPATAGFNGVFDPCEAAALGENPNRPANCAALGVTFDDATDNQFPGVSSGNPNLKPEVAKTWTAGFIYQPQWAPGLALTVDYYDIRIKNAITYLDPQDAADKCVDGPELAAQYCDLIIRDPVSRQIVSYRSSYLNQAALKTAGWDVQLSYAHDINWGVMDGRFNASINANYLEKLRDFAFSDFPETVDREEGEVGDPRWRFISSATYTQGRVSLTWESQYMSKVRRDRDASLERSDAPWVEANWYHDVIARLRLDDVGKGLEVYAGINNIGNELIPMGLTGQGTSSSYDIFGRFLFGGMKARF
jgi:outer membrane receptor protein involved in Fe transport